MKLISISGLSPEGLANDSLDLSATRIGSASQCVSSCHGISVSRQFIYWPFSARELINSMHSVKVESSNENSPMKTHQQLPTHQLTSACVCCKTTPLSVVCYQPRYYVVTLLIRPNLISGVFEA